MKSFLLGFAAIAFFGTAAQAQVSGSMGGGSGPFLTLSNAGLNGGSVATLSGGNVLASDQPFADIPAGGVFGGTFLAAGPTVSQPAILTFAVPVSYLSFLWGSPDTYNSLAITTNLGEIVNFTAGGMGFPVTNGNQSFSQYVQFSATGGRTIASASFTNNPVQDAFEVANFSTTPAVPEPATWAMMLIGFGAIGAATRRRRTTTLATAAA